MLEKIMYSVRSVKTLCWVHGRSVSVGEVSRYNKIPYSTLRRILTKAEKNGLVRSELVDYKKTGKIVFWVTDKGEEFLKQFRELPL